MASPSIPMLGVAAYSGTGKTTLLIKLIAIFKARGLRVGVVKHAHHSFEIDHPGKDSYELRMAGARQVLIGSTKRWALLAEMDDSEHRTLHDHVRHLDLDNLDLILVEGFKPENIPKIEVCRPSLGKPPLYPRDKSVIAIATDDPRELRTSLPVLDLNDAGAIVEFIIDRFLPGDQNNGKRTT